MADIRRGYEKESIPSCESVWARLQDLEAAHVDLHATTAEIAERQLSYEKSMATLNESMAEAGKALSEISVQLKNLAPLFNTYSDLRATGRVVGWIAGNFKGIAMIFLGLALLAKGETIYEIIKAIV